MPSQARTPGSVAKLLGCSTDTIRRYSATYAEHLSAGANPGPGKARTYSAEDLAVLQLVRDATQAGGTVEEVRALLANVTLPAAGEDEPAAAELATTTGPESITLLMRQLAATVDRLDERDRRVDDLRAEVEQLRTVVNRIEQSPQPVPVVPPRWPAWVVYLLGIAAVAGVIAAVAVVVWLLGQG